MQDKITSSQHFLMLTRMSLIECDQVHQAGKNRETPTFFDQANYRVCS